MRFIVIDVFLFSLLCTIGCNDKATMILREREPVENGENVLSDKENKSLEGAVIGSRNHHA